MQYLRPESFDPQIQESRFYVVLYNGVCYKLVANAWQEVVMEGAEDYSVDIYAFFALRAIDSEGEVWNVH
jgi:hypothetical protein